MSPTLVINAPWQKVQEENKRSFDDYAIPSALYAQLSPGCRVVLLCKDKERRAEGTLASLDPKSKTNSGMQRYDVHINGLIEVTYKSEKLLRTGVAVLWK